MAGIMHMLLSSASSIVTDAYFNLVTLLLPGNGTNGAQNNTFLDSSSNAFTITRNGNTTQGTFSPFSQTGWSNYFNGSTDYLSFTSNATTIGTGDFTIETWIYPGSQPSTSSTIIGGSVSGTPLFNINGTGTATTISLNAFGSANAISASYTFTIGVWFHIAVTRSGTSLKLFVNGTQVGTTATDSTNFSAPVKVIGSTTAGQWYAGYVSNARVVVGTAVYTSNFTPSTTPLTAITNTNVLTCQSNRFIDNSTNAFAITPSGTPSVQAFSPFAPTAAYSASTNGGSGYFDGSGDYLYAASNAAFAPGTGDFTWEAWIYPTSLSATYVPIFVVSIVSSGGLWIGKNGSNFVLRAANVADQLVTSTLPSLNQWTHIAVVRSGSTASIYYNGVSIVSGTVTYNFSQDQANIGSDATGAYFSGYISNCRLVKGTAVYTSNFTPPTAPLTAITNTSLLLSCTNAGIIDNAAKNDLETVGNAQISTTQSKFGGSSMSFDGTNSYLVLADNNILEFGSGDLTLEMWINTGATAQYTTLYSREPAAYGTGMWALQVNQSAASSGNVGLFIWDFNSGAATPILASSGTGVCDNTWHHIAVVRNGSSWALYIDGVSRATNTWSGSVVDLSTGPRIGNSQNYGRYYSGYIDDFRFTKYARYTSNFTVPSAAFPLS